MLECAKQSVLKRVGNRMKHLSTTRSYGSHVLARFVGEIDTCIHVLTDRYSTMFHTLPYPSCHNFLGWHGNECKIPVSDISLYISLLDYLLQNCFPEWISPSAPTPLPVCLYFMRLILLNHALHFIPSKLFVGLQEDHQGKLHGHLILTTCGSGIPVISLNNCHATWWGIGWRLVKSLFLLMDLHNAPVLLVHAALYRVLVHWMNFAGWLVRWGLISFIVCVSTSTKLASTASQLCFWNQFSLVLMWSSFVEWYTRRERETTFHWFVGNSIFVGVRPEQWKVLLVCTFMLLSHKFMHVLWNKIT